jgi:hypothetical protein
VDARIRRIRAAEQTAEPEDNARLTALTAVVLLVLLAIEGATLLSLQTFISWHIVVGMLLVPIVALKLGSTGYRFARYYLRNEAYVRAGPPPLPLRLLGPVLIVATAGLFASGIALAALGPGAPLVLLLHKASFAVWVAAMTIHVLWHLARMTRLASSDVAAIPRETGSRLRMTTLATAVTSGAVLAVATFPLVAPWTHWVGGG